MSEKTELEDEQSRQIDKSRRACREAIFRFYTIEDQLNTLGLQGCTETDRSKMWAVIAAHRARHVEIKAAVNSASTAEEAASIEIDYSDINT